jgi:DNA invertase Pin-like site-specific DNA recombinase
MPKQVRTAIYTRKSTEEGLEQDFNSLDAQREACSAFILSQRHEGWREMPEHFDDGGFSGGSMERPALIRLLDAVEAGEIDVVVVYKVDRLTRSLADFARIVQIFDGAGASFVSVTQQFNTTTSMGRLTLNVLLSFAQFEREVTAERIRDKIAASKAKGMWMGGIPPIGYRAENRKLVVDEDQARTVRQIFTRYLELDSVRRLQAELEMSGTRTPVRISRAGRASGGAAFSRGKLYAMLSNPVYIGKIRHRAKIHDGQHDALVGRETWDRVQACLQANRVRHCEKSDAARSSPFAGKLFDPAGNQMRPVHSKKNGRRYRYYVSPSLVDSSKAAGAKGWRIPAEEIEARVSQAVTGKLVEPATTAQFLSKAPGQDADVLDGLARTRELLSAPNSTDCKTLLRSITQRIDLDEDKLRATFDLGPALTLPVVAMEIEAPIQLVRRGAELKLILQGASGEAATPDPNLVQAVLDARRRLDAYVRPVNPMSLKEIAQSEGIDTGDVSRSLQLAFLAPEAVRAILDGRQAPSLTATRLTRIGNLPLLWDEQIDALR